MEELNSYFQLLGENLEENEITEWLDSDSTDKGYSQLTDDEIIAEVTGQSNSESVASDDEEDAVIIQESTCNTISHGQALQMFDTCISWLQQQDEVSVTTYLCYVIYESWQLENDLAHLDKVV